MPGAQFRPDDELGEQIIALYVSGVGPYEIVRRLDIGRDPETITRFIERSGLPTRRKSEFPGCFITCMCCKEQAPKTHARQRFCLECIPGPRWRALFANYGIGKKQFDEKFEAQSGLCGVCQKPMDYDLDRIVMDHCHEQGHVRDILHNRCNIGLSYVEDSEFVGLAVKYIEKHRR